MSISRDLMPPISHQEAVLRARALAPTIQARADIAERIRRQPIETINDIRDAGLMRLLTPKRWGGDELGFDAFVDAVLEIARVDASAGWCYGFLNIHAWLLAYFPEEAQRDVWAETPDVTLVAATIPGGKPQPVEGGYRLSGKWAWVSGIDHCEWAMLTGHILNADGRIQETRLFLVPCDDYKIVDDWFVVGLKGSGSKSVIAEDIFVPTHRTITMQALLQAQAPGSQVNTGPLYQFPLMAAFPIALAAPVLGAAMGAYETWRNNMRSSYTTFSRERIAEKTHQQIRLAEVAQDIATAELLLRRVLDVLRSEQPVTDELRIRTRLDYATIATLCRGIVEQLFTTSGGSVNYEWHAIQRYWRDIHAMTLHARLNFDPAAEGFARSELELPPNASDPFAS